MLICALSEVLHAPDPIPRVFPATKIAVQSWF